MTFTEIFDFSAGDFERLAGLMKELNESIELSREALGEMLADADSHLYVLRDEQEQGRIAACACLCAFHQPFRLDATIEAVVVSSEYRGRGLGRLIVGQVIEEAGRLGVRQLHLTSSPFRIAANALYPKLGFRRKDTNCYIMNL